MSKIDPELVYIRSTDKNKYVCLKINNTQHLYVLNQEEINNTIFDEYYPQNKTAFKYLNNENGILIHNMYDSQNMFYKSAIYDKSKTVRDGTTYDFKNVFSHNLSSSLTSIIQINNTLYSYEKLSQYGHIEMTSDSYSYLSIDNGSIELQNKTIETYTYNRDIVQKLVDDDVPKPEPGTEIKNIFKGIEYNTIFEIPGTIQNDYDSGNIAANTFKGKNHLNSLYDMSHTSSTDLVNAREYVGIGTCNNQLFLKYYDYCEYTENTKIGQNITVDKSINNQIYNLKIPHIETFSYISRYANQNGHKSNLYSLRISSQILDKSNLPDITDKKLNNIKQSIKNSVKSIVEKLQPVHTQLFKIYI